jgi:hypothetical protein
MEAPHNRYGPVGDKVLECHHLVPLAVSGPTERNSKTLFCYARHAIASLIAYDPGQRSKNSVAYPASRTARRV